MPSKLRSIFYIIAISVLFSWCRYVGRVEYLLEAVGQVAAIVEQVASAEVALACDTWDSAVETQLTANFVAFAPSISTFLFAQVEWSHTDIHFASFGSMLSPPMCKNLIISYFLANLPIELRNHVVNPTLLHPKKDISIELVVVLQTIGLATTFVILFVAPDTEWRDTKLYIRFDAVDGLMHSLNC